MMKYIAPGSWFSLEYPSDWREFEDTEDSFLFDSPDKWVGDVRISACGGENGSDGRECVYYDRKHTQGARLVKAGGWDGAYSTENFQENGS